MSIPQTTVPALVDQLSVEDLTWGVDCTALVPASSIAATTATLTSATGVVVTLADAPVIDGDVVAVRIRAGVLTRGTYQLVVTVAPVGTTNVLAAVTQITCPF
jgi:hypothetical protein